MATDSISARQSRPPLCGHCKQHPIPENRRRYCSEACLRAATRDKSRDHKRRYRQNGDIKPNDYWLMVGMDEKRAYFRRYMRDYRARRKKAAASGDQTRTGD